MEIWRETSKVSGELLSGSLPDFYMAPETVKQSSSLPRIPRNNGIRKNMTTRTFKPVKEFFTESEAAGYLNISLDELYSMLDEYIFNDGSPRPRDLTFCE